MHAGMNQYENAKQVTFFTFLCWSFLYFASHFNDMQLHKKAKQISLQATMTRNSMKRNTGFLILLLPTISTRVLGLSIINPSTIQSIHDVSTSMSHILHHSTTNIASTTAATDSTATNLLDLYKQTLADHPLPTKMITGGSLAVAGDAIAQSRDKDEPYNQKRAFSFMAFDMCYRALQHISFPVIVQQCQGQYIGGAIASIPLLASSFASLGLDDPTYYYGAMEQTLASQLGIVPFLYYPVFYVLTAFVQGLDAEGAVNRAKETFIPLMKRNLVFWIPGENINESLFRFNRLISMHAKYYFKMS